MNTNTKFKTKTKTTKNYYRNLNTTKIKPTPFKNITNNKFSPYKNKDKHSGIVSTKPKRNMKKYKPKKHTHFKSFSMIKYNSKIRSIFSLNSLTISSRKTMMISNSDSKSFKKKTILSKKDQRQELYTQTKS